MNLKKINLLKKYLNFIFVIFNIILLNILAGDDSDSDLKTILQLNGKISRDSYIRNDFTEMEIYPFFEISNFEKSTDSIYIDKNQNRKNKSSPLYKKYNLKEEDVFIFDKISIQEVSDSSKQIKNITDYLDAKKNEINDSIKNSIDKYFSNKSGKYTLNIKSIIQDDSLKEIPPMIISSMETNGSKWIKFSYTNTPFSINKFLLLMEKKNRQEYIILECELNDKKDDINAVKQITFSEKDFEDSLFYRLDDNNKISFFKDKNKLIPSEIKKEIGMKLKKDQIKPFLIESDKIGTEKEILYIKNPPKRFKEKIFKLIDSKEEIKNEIEIDNDLEKIIAKKIEPAIAEQAKKIEPAIEEQAKKEEQVIKQVVKEESVKQEPSIEQPKIVVEATESIKLNEAEKINGVKKTKNLGQFNIDSFQINSTIKNLPNNKKQKKLSHFNIKSIEIKSNLNKRRVVVNSLLGISLISMGIFGYLKHKKYIAESLKNKELISRMISEKKNLSKKYNILLKENSDIKYTNKIKNLLFTLIGGGIGYSLKSKK